MEKKAFLMRGGFALVALVAFVLGFAGLEFFRFEPELGMGKDDGQFRVEATMSSDFSEEPRIEAATQLPMNMTYEVGVAFLDTYNTERYQVRIESMEHSLGYNGQEGDFLLVKGKIAVLNAGGAFAPPHLLFFGRDFPPDGLLGATYHADTLLPMGANRAILKDGAQFDVFWVCRLSSRTGHVLKRLADSEVLISVGSALGGSGHDGAGANLTYIEINGKRLEFDQFERYSTNSAFQSLEFAHGNARKIEWEALPGSWRRIAFKTVSDWVKKPTSALAGLAGYREGVYDMEQTVKIGGRELSLNKVEFQDDPGGIPMPRSKGVIFANVTLTLRVLERDDATPVVINHHAFQVADRASAYVTKHVYIPRLGNQLMSTILYPGNEMTRCLVFPVPAGTRELQLLVDSGNLFGRRIIVNLEPNTKSANSRPVSLQRQAGAKNGG